MATYTTARKAKRQEQLNKRKDALKQLSNFSSILNNMNKLYEEIENYNGVITEDKLNEIARLINLEKKLSLSEEQINMVTKKYLE